MDSIRYSIAIVRLLTIMSGMSMIPIGRERENDPMLAVLQEALDMTMVAQMSWLPVCDPAITARVLSRALSWMMPVVRSPTTERHRYGWRRVNVLIQSFLIEPDRCRYVFLPSAHPDVVAATRVALAHLPAPAALPSVLPQERTRRSDALIAAHLAGHPLPSQAINDLAAIPSAAERLMIHGVVHPALWSTVKAVPWVAGNMLVAGYTHDTLIVSAAAHPAVAARVLRYRRDLDDARLLHAVARDPEAVLDCLADRPDLRRHPMLVAAVARQAASASEVLMSYPDLRQHPMLVAAVARQAASASEVLMSYPDLRQHPMLVAAVARQAALMPVRSTVRIGDRNQHSYGSDPEPAITESPEGRRS